MLIDALYVLLSYIVGAAPIVHILAKTHGVDLRTVGSGNVGATNLWQHAGPVIGAVGTVVDFAKGVIPPLGALALGLGVETAALSGLAVVVGQMWPVFLGFRGGRGNLTGVGALAAVAPGALLIGAVPVTIGALAKWGQKALGVGRPDVFGVALGVFLGALAITITAWLKDYPWLVSACVTAITSLVILRRLTAQLDQDLQAPPGERPGILVTRLLLDRARL